MNIGPQPEKKRTEIETGAEAQTHTPAGPMGVLRGVVSEVEVGAERGPTGRRRPGTRGTRSPLTPVTADTTEAAASLSSR